MKREKKSQKKVSGKSKIAKQKKQVKQKPAPKSPSRNIFGAAMLTVLVLIVGFLAFSQFLTGDYLFFFKDIGSDSINQNIPAIQQRVNLYEQEGRDISWSFYKGMGDTYGTDVPKIEPYSILMNEMNYIGMQLFGTDYFLIGRFIRIFVFGFLLSALFFYAYLRTLSVDKYSAMLGGLLIGFSGFMVVGSGWGFSSHVMEASFLLLAFEQLYLKKRWYLLPFAFIWLSSNVFNLYVYSLFLLIYSLFRLTADNQSLKEYLKTGGKVLLLGSIALLMNLTQVYKSFEKLFFSPRVAGNASYSQALSAGEDISETTSMGATTLLRFFSNDILGTGSNYQAWNNYLEAPLFYVGIFTLLVFPQIFIFLNKRKKIVFGAFLTLWVSTLLFPYLRRAFLAFTGDYFRYGFDFFIPFAFLFMAVWSVHHIIKKQKINLPLLGGTLAVLLLILYFPYSSLPEGAIDTQIRGIVSVLLLLYSLLLFLLAKPEHTGIAKYALLFLITAETAFFSYRSYSEREALSYSEYERSMGGYQDGSIRAVEFIKQADGSPFYRIEKDYQSGAAEHGSLNDAMAQGYYGTASYSSFNQLNYIRFLEEVQIIQKGDETATRWSVGFRGNPVLQTFGNVKYHLSKTQKPPFMRFGFDSLTQVAGVKILKNRFYLPFGYSYDRYIKFDDFKSLTEYRIDLQRINNVYTELSRRIPKAELDPIINKLQKINNTAYKNRNAIDSAVSETIETGDSLIIRTIRKHSVVNFKNQIALLNAFVYENNTDIDTSKLERLNLNDTSLLVPPEKFNFNLYKQYVNRLRQDSMQITHFENDYIKGKISLDSAKMLFFSIPYDEAWQVKLNGKPQKLKRVNIGFSGLMLPAGDHEIELYHELKMSRLTNTVSYAATFGFYAFLLFILFKKYQKRRKKSSESV